ncbi:MAG: hypothetical protein IPM63_10325 [Acidobacteriota bacterium]|nr:MAG: hypothetical protein IPM63_10325 [Acidobacteriota bacterium]
MRELLTKLGSRSLTALNNIRRFCIYLAASKPTDVCDRIAYVDVTEPALERYFYCFVKFLQLGGFSVYLRFRPKLLLNLRNYSELIYEIPGFRVSFGDPGKADLVIRDRPSNSRTEEELLLSTDYFNAANDPEGFAFPYSMHPLIYHLGLDDQITSLRARQRESRIFFYSANLESYRNPEMETLFGKLNREGVAEVVRNYASDLTPDEMPAAIRLAEDERIPFEDWLPTLAASSFFVAAPGVVMPYSHNLLEAMAVGTIPITEYPELFHPPLEDGMNCIRFSGREGLREALGRACRLREDEIDALRKRVVEYYDTYLDPESAVSQLLSSADSVERIYLLSGHLSVSALKKRKTQPMN